MINIVTLVHEVQSLTDRYGFQAVKDAVNFIENLQTKSKIVYIFYDFGSNKYYISEAQFKRIQAEWYAGNKIQAIKLFREFTSTGLKDAKDAIESFPWRDPKRNTKNGV